MSVTARSILSQALVGERPYDQAQRIIEHLDRAGWVIERRPPIPEPGLWGVVAHDGRNYVHTTLFDWRSGDYVVDWADIKDGATLVRPGLDD